jgi:hypothetical protein
MSTPTPERIQSAIENVDHNIRMFSGYRETDWTRSQLECMRADRVELVELAAGERPYESLSWTNKERFYDMPAWGTYGT